MVPVQMVTRSTENEVFPVAQDNMVTDTVVVSDPAARDIDPSLLTLPSSIHAQPGCSTNAGSEIDPAVRWRSFGVRGPGGDPILLLSGRKR